MLRRLDGTGTGRKLRLFLVASARLVWDQVPQGPVRDAVEASERYADGSETAERLDADRGYFYSFVMPGRTEEQADWIRSRDKALVFEVVRMTSYPDPLVRTLPKNNNWRDRIRAIHPQLAPFVRDVFGNPFRPVAFAPAWRTDTAVALARQMYDAYDFGAMPILADALQDAGCDDEAVLTHCQNGAAHVRGCWVVDAVLGKE